MNIVANSIGHHVTQPTQESPEKLEGDSLFASLFTNEISSKKKEPIIGEDKLQKMIQRLKEILSSSNQKNIEKDDVRVILPITLKEDVNSVIFAVDDKRAKGQASLGLTKDEPSTFAPDATNILFMQIIEQMLSLDTREGISDETLMQLTPTLEAYLQGSANSLTKINEADVTDQIHFLFPEKIVTTEEMADLANLLENMLQRVNSETSENYSLSLFLGKMVETLENTLLEQELEQSMPPLTDHFSTNIHFIHEETGGMNNAVFLDEFQRISKDAQQLIEDIVQNEHTSTSNKQLLELLEQVKSLKQTFNEIPSEELIEGDEVTKNTWMNLQSMYEKRSSLNKSGSYFHNARVRSSDVGVWVDRLTSEHAVTQAQPAIQLQQHMSPVEHFVLHTRIQNGQVVQQETFIHQLQQIVQQSAIGKNHLFKQLSISIQPEQLGEMTIQLVKIDGEMIAKITVSSQATKSALDSNLHQLKNMFAPHQVLIEKQDGEEQTTFEQEDSKEEHHPSSHENEKDSHTEEQQEQSFEEQFEQILAEVVGES